jgi:hypothetical protein
MDVRSQGSQLDNTTWKRTIYRDLARPFAYLNFGDANLAPWTWWDVKGQNEYADNARQFQAVGTAIETLRRGGVEFRDEAKVRRWISENFGLSDFPDFKFVAPVTRGGTGSGAATGAEAKVLELTPTDMATVVTVDEARANAGLGPAGEDGSLTLAEFKAKHAAVIADAAAADAGQEGPTDTNAVAPMPEGDDDGEDEDEEAPDDDS